LSTLTSVTPHPLLPDDGTSPSGGDRTIALDHLTVTAPGAGQDAVLLEGVSVTLSAARTAVIGENGSGKSTLARAIAALVPAASGTVTVHGVDAAQDVKALRRILGMVFANPAAQSIMPTVREDVELTVNALRDPAGRKLGKTEVAARVQAALAEHRLTELADRPCLSLSSGQAQRLAMCSVMVGQPQVVIADEPTSLLDGRHRRIVAERLLGGAGRGEFQLLLVTHDLELARDCDEAVWIHEGRLRAHGPAAQVVGEYERFLEEEFAGEAADVRGEQAAPAVGEGRGGGEEPSS
jgi:biotin transport system ATP-binding protein